MVLTERTCITTAEAQRAEVCKRLHTLGYLYADGSPFYPDRLDPHGAALYYPVLGRALRVDDDDCIDVDTVLVDAATFLNAANYADQDTKEAPEHESILAEAARIVTGARAADYGSAEESFSRIAALTELMLNESERASLAVASFPPTVAVKVLMAVKLARESNKHKRDNLVDLCGYAELLNQLREL